MIALHARRSGAGWKACLKPAAPAEAAGIARATPLGRAKAWQLAARLGHDASPWELEYQKAALGSPEIVLGYAHLLADGCEATGAELREATVAVPAAYASARTANQELAFRGLTRRSLLRAQSWLDRLRFGLAASLALASFIAYLLLFGRKQGAGEEFAQASGTAFALHGEWATRTQHLLKGLGDAAPSCIVLIGRMRKTPAELANEWRTAHGLRMPPLVVPFSPGAALRATGRMAALLRDGWKGAPDRLFLPPLREHVAIVFRVLLGAAMHQWWKTQGAAFKDVVFGHTGTADTAQLERAMQARGTRTLHAVHGLATGPNFTACSDVAFFRCGHDADRYQPLGVYGRCAVQEASRPLPVQGKSGIFLLTNLAHPMNPGFTANGPVDEIALLRQVAEAAALVSPDPVPKLWRPHPVLRRLPPDIAQRVRDEAKSLGFEEQDPAQPMGPAAAAARWVITSPSTTAVDLLAQGILPIVVDLQQSAAGSATGCFPCPAGSAPELAALMRELDNEPVYVNLFEQTWERVRPARPWAFAELSGSME